MDPSPCLSRHLALTWEAETLLQVTDAEFAQTALEKPPERCAAQNPAQQAHVLARTPSQEEIPAHEKTPVLQGFATECDILHSRKVGVTGLEPVTPTMST